LESIIVVILREVYCLFFSASTMSRNHPSDEVGKSYTHPVGLGEGSRYQGLRCAWPME